MTNTALGEWGEQIVMHLSAVVVGEPVERVGVGRGRTEPVDMESASYAVEVKTVLAGTEEKIRPAKRAMASKRAYCQRTGKHPLMVLVVLAPATWRATVYRKEGLGAFRSGAMENLGTYAVRAWLAPQGAA